MNEIRTIKEPVLRELIQVTGQVSATIAGEQSGFALTFQIGDAEKTLLTARGSVRKFASLDTAGAYVRDLGIPRFAVDMTGHEPGRLRRPRPDRAEALRHTRTKMHQQPLEFTNAEPNQA